MVDQVFLIFRHGDDPVGAQHHGEIPPLYGNRRHADVLQRYRIYFYHTALQLILVNGHQIHAHGRFPRFI